MQTNKWKSSAKPLCIWLYKLIGYSPPIFGVKMLRSSSIEFRVRREWNVPKMICTSLRRHVVPFVNGRFHFYDTWKSFDLLLRVFLWKRNKMATHSQTRALNQDPSYPNLSPLSQHYHIDPPKFPRIFNNYSSSPNGLWVKSQWGQRPNGLLTQRPWRREE